mmetsp:Transcript_16622/g.49247  ORF Transcript_16622/g.49247 Transcript_16622/m.49247 type:complete len:595 (+) Transcript_16622:1490-3274(+)
MVRALQEARPPAGCARPQRLMHVLLQFAHLGIARQPELLDAHRERRRGARLVRVTRHEDPRVVQQRAAPPAVRVRVGAHVAGAAVPRVAAVAGEPPDGGREVAVPLEQCRRGLEQVVVHELQQLAAAVCRRAPPVPKRETAAADGHRAQPEGVRRRCSAREGRRLEAAGWVAARRADDLEALWRGEVEARVGHVGVQRRRRQRSGDGHSGGEQRLADALDVAGEDHPQAVRRAAAGRESGGGGGRPRRRAAPLGPCVRLRVHHHLVQHLVHPVVVGAVLLLERAPALEAAPAGRRAALRPNVLSAVSAQRQHKQHRPLPRRARHLHVPRLAAQVHLGEGAALGDLRQRPAREHLVERHRQAEAADLDAARRVAVCDRQRERRLCAHHPHLPPQSEAPPKRQRRSEAARRVHRGGEAVPRQSRLGGGGRKGRLARDGGVGGVPSRRASLSHAQREVAEVVEALRGPVERQRHSARVGPVQLHGRVLEGHRVREGRVRSRRDGIHRPRRGTHADKEGVAGSSAQAEQAEAGVLGLGLCNLCLRRQRRGPQPGFRPELLEQRLDVSEPIVDGPLRRRSGGRGHDRLRGGGRGGRGAG